MELFWVRILVLGAVACFLMTITAVLGGLPAWKQWGPMLPAIGFLIAAHYQLRKVERRIEQQY